MLVVVASVVVVVAVVRPSLEAVSESKKKLWLSAAVDRILVLEVLSTSS